MSRTQEHYADQFCTLLPDAEVFDSDDVRSVAMGLSGEASRLDAAALQHLADFVPDTAGDSGTYLEDWADLLALPEAFESDAWGTTYTDAQKAAIIRAKLRGRVDPNLANVQSALRELFSDSAAELSHKEHPAFLCGAGACGAGVGESWTGVWSWRYMDHAINVADPDDFGAWDNVSSVSNAVAQSPVTETQVADLVTGVTAGAGAWGCSTAIDDTEDVDSVRMSVWCRAAVVDQQIQLQVLQRDGSTVVASTLVNARTDLWQKLSFVASVGSGGSDPLMRVVWSEATQMYLAHARAGIRQPTLEQRAQQLAPLHTVGEFLVKGEDEA